MFLMILAIASGITADLIGYNRLGNNLSRHVFAFENFEDPVSVQMYNFVMANAGSISNEEKKAWLAAFSKLTSKRCTKNCKRQGVRKEVVGRQAPRLRRRIKRRN